MVSIMVPPLLLPPIFPEPFAVEWGHDKYGTFQSFAVGNVVQRMRWIPPGSFMMGSPKDEVGRGDDEVQHRVELTQGYWLGDTPVTQALWEAVMVANPSRFRDAQKPIEMVNWHDCQQFLNRLSENMQGAVIRLPTEAEWEYACRANTNTATWMGNGQSTLDPQLVAIAWYWQNAEGTTQRVAQKSANPWGLYDMLGNVNQWCADGYGPYDVKAVRDPQGPSTSTYGLIRGGSWISPARYLRAGYRCTCHRERRYDRIGLRIAHSPKPLP